MQSSILWLRVKNKNQNKGGCQSFRVRQNIKATLHREREIKNDVFKQLIQYFNGKEYIGT